MSKKLAPGVAIAAVFLLLPARPASAQDTVASFYRGKTITFLVGTTVGSGYDAYARMIARHISRHLPGSPAAIVSNRPGAGSNIAANYISNAAPKDGTVVGALLAGSTLEPLLGTAEVHHDPSKTQYIGSANKDVYVCAARKTAEVKTFEDVFQKELLVGASPRTGISDYPKVLNAVLHTKFKIVLGYPGNREISLAVDRGEVSGVCGVAWPSLSAVNPGWFDPGGPMRVLVQTDNKGYPGLNRDGVPNAINFAKTDEQRQLLEFFFARGVFGRPYVVAPEVPKERVEALRKAFVNTLADPELLTEAKKLNLDVDPVPGDEVQRVVASMYATPRELTVKLKNILEANP